MFKSKKLNNNLNINNIRSSLNNLMSSNTILFRPILIKEQKNKIYIDSNIFGLNCKETIKWFKRFNFPYNLFYRNNYYKLEKHGSQHYFKIFLFDIIQEYMKKFYIKNGKYPWYVDIVIEPNSCFQFGLNSYNNKDFTTVYDLKYKHETETKIYRLFFDINKIIRNKKGKDDFFKTLTNSNNLFKDLSIKGIICKTIYLKDYVYSFPES